MIKNIHILPVFILLNVLLLVGCGSEPEQNNDGKAETNSDLPAVFPSSHPFEFTIGGKAFTAEIMLSDSEMERGLMYRKELAEDHGMIFVFRNRRKASFWMKNTLIPLDIGYFTTDGVLREIYQLEPGSETPVASKSVLIHYALEMNQGWFEKNGIQPGDSINIDVLKAAMKARGGRIEAFNIK